MEEDHRSYRRNFCSCEKLIFFHIILHSTVDIYDFHIFITLSLISYAVLITNHRFISVIDSGIFFSNSTSLKRKSKVLATAVRYSNQRNARTKEERAITRKISSPFLPSRQINIEFRELNFSMKVLTILLQHIMGICYL